MARSRKASGGELILHTCGKCGATSQYPAGTPKEAQACQACTGGAPAEPVLGPAQVKRVHAEIREIQAGDSAKAKEAGR